MTSESSASPVSPSLRDRIAATLHDVDVDRCVRRNAQDCLYIEDHRLAADAVVALLGLTEQRDYETTFAWPLPSVRSARLVGPWYPVNPDSSEGTR